MVLADPHVDCAVLEVARGGILRAGLGVRDVDVGAVLNVQSDHLGLRGVNTLDDLAVVKRVIVEVATDTAVLNADDPRVLRMADYTDAKHVCYVTMNPQHSLVREHIKTGGRAVALEAGMGGQMITIYDHGAHIPLLWTHRIPATIEGKATHNVQNAMFAAAMAFSMGVRLEDIRHGLQSFESSFFQAPGRGNIYNEHPFKVILDYGHNAPAVEAMCNLASRLEVEGRRICVLAAPGDRRDEDITAIGRIAATHGFDHYVCKRDDNPRGRGDDEVAKLLAAALAEGGIAKDRVEIIPDEVTALDRALQLARPGDLLLCFIDQISRSWSQVAQFRPDLPASARKSDRTNVVPDLPEVAEPQVGLLEAIIRDERGVRLAKEQED
jgi:cyanophycin synthetase